MSTLIAYADGNMTGSTTFKGAETGASALAMIRANTTTLAQNASVSSPNFTITNGDVVEGVLLWVMANQSSPAGTMLVELQLGGATQSSVTVNTSDLPHSATGTNDVLAVVPIFFKYTASHTSSGGTTYTIKLTLSNTAGNGITYSRNSGTAGDFTKALRTSTTATPAAGDDLYIVGELTGAGTHNSRAVTMDSTTTTQYGNGTVNSTSANGGGIRVSCYASLSYGTTASANYYLRVKGDVEAFWNGTITEGSSGAEIPRNSTAVLELVMNSASGDFGVIGRNGSTVNTNGLSRTSGKNIVRCKLTADVASVSTGGNLGATNGSTAAGTDFSGASQLATAFTDNSTNGNHCYGLIDSSSRTNVTQVGQVWLAQGSGTHNRFVRVLIGNTSIFGSVANGFYSDIDLQAGTAGTITALGNGTATNVAITPVGTGYLVTIIGKCSTATVNPCLFIAACSASGTVSYAGDTTQCFIFEGAVIVTASSLGNTTFNVDTDTGWLSGDVVAVASTTRTAADAEAFALNANAGSTSFTSAQYPFGYGGPTSTVNGTHNGTPAAEVQLLNRNVKIRTNTSALTGYVFFEPGAVVNMAWTEVYYMGSNATNKRGIETKDGLSGSVGAKSITYCSIHDSFIAMYCNTAASTSLNLTFSNNTMFNLTSNFVEIAGATGSDYTFDSNTCMRNSSSAAGALMIDLSGTFTNNWISSAAGPAIQYSPNAISGVFATIGTVSGNVVHSSATGFSYTGSVGGQGVIDTLTTYRNSGNGILSNNIYSDDLIFTNLTCYGNGSANYNLNQGNQVNIYGGTMCGDTSFVTTHNFIISGNEACLMDIRSVDMSGVGGTYTPCTADEISYSAGAPCGAQIYLPNCKFGAPALYNSKVNWPRTNFISMERYNQTTGDHRTEMPVGQLKTDTSIYHTASPSMRMTPSSTTKKLESAPKGRGFLVPVASGVAGSISVYIRKAIGSDSGTGSFNPSDKTPQITLSNSNLTATLGGSPSSDGVRSTTGRSLGKWYVQMTIGATAITSGGYGAALAATPIGVLWNNLGILVAAANGDIKLNGTASGKNIGTPVAGDVIDMALDLDNAQAWFRRNNGNWNGDVSANPATNTGGVAIGTLFSSAPAYFYMATLSGPASSSVTVNAGGSAFTNSVPSGFGSWDDGAAYNGNQPRLIQRANAALGQSSDVVLATYSSAGGSWNQLSASTSTPTDDGCFEIIVDCDGTAGWINVDDPS